MLIATLPTHARRLRVGVAIALIASVLMVPSVSAQDRTPPPLVTVATASIAPVVGRISVSGTLVARNEILIYPLISGFNISALNVDVGDYVHKGDVLAELNRQTLEAQLMQARAANTQAEAAVRQAASQINSAQASQIQAQAALERTNKLNASGNVTQVSVDQALAGARTAQAAVQAATDGQAVAQAQQAQAEAALRIAEFNLDHARILAPADGLISARSGQVGAIAAASGDPIYRLIVNGTLEVEAEVIETDLGQVTVGDSTELSVAGVGEVGGTVRLISPTVDPQTRLGTIRIGVPLQDSLRSGLFSSGWVTTQHHDGVTVPVTAVLTDADGTYVQLLDKDVITRRPVVTGLIWQNRREILSGLSAGDAVVAKAGAFFGNGDHVTPVSEPDAAAVAGAAQ
ncbi:efflux RND transporter periplasmic adaptor subunit [Thioclava sp.]|uniref:efflux RND transporter periplasmic adaptor subunit n=1 Tax=Thioclava sp. TaxID=1933450 RepID=UPI003AA8B389